MKSGKKYKYQTGGDMSMECPEATLNPQLDIANRDNATADENIAYNPTGGTQENACGNCAVFDISQRMSQCMQEGGETVGYCWSNQFKCEASAICSKWEQGGPIASDDVSYDIAARYTEEQVPMEEPNIQPPEVMEPSMQPPAQPPMAMPEMQMAKFGGAVRGLPKAYAGNMGPYRGNSPSFKKFVARKDKDTYSRHGQFWNPANPMQGTSLGDSGLFNFLGTLGTLGNNLKLNRQGEYNEKEDYMRTNISVPNYLNEDIFDYYNAENIMIDPYEKWIGEGKDRKPNLMWKGDYDTREKDLYNKHSYVERFQGEGGPEMIFHRNRSGVVPTGSNFSSIEDLRDNVDWQNYMGPNMGDWTWTAQNNKTGPMYNTGKPVFTQSSTKKCYLADGVTEIPCKEYGGSLPKFQGTGKSEVNMLGNTAEEQALINAQTRSKQVAFPTEYYNLRDAYDAKGNWEDQNINAYFSGAPYPHQAQLDSLKTVYDNLVIPQKYGGSLPKAQDKNIENITRGWSGMTQADLWKIQELQRQQNQNIDAGFLIKPDELGGNTNTGDDGFIIKEEGWNNPNKVVNDPGFYRFNVDNNLDSLKTWKRGGSLPEAQGGYKGNFGINLNLPKVSKPGKYGFLGGAGLGFTYSMMNPKSNIIQNARVKNEAQDICTATTCPTASNDWEDYVGRANMNLDIGQSSQPGIYSSDNFAPGKPWNAALRTGLNTIGGGITGSILTHGANKLANKFFPRTFANPGKLISFRQDGGVSPAFDELIGDYDTAKAIEQASGLDWSDSPNLAYSPNYNAADDAFLESGEMLAPWAPKETVTVEDPNYPGEFLSTPGGSDYLANADTSNIDGWVDPYSFYGKTSTGKQATPGSQAVSSGNTGSGQQPTWNLSQRPTVGKSRIQEAIGRQSDCPPCPEEAMGRGAIRRFERDNPRPSHCPPCDYYTKKERRQDRRGTRGGIDFSAIGDLFSNIKLPKLGKGPSVPMFPSARQGAELPKAQWWNSFNGQTPSFDDPTTWSGMGGGQQWGGDDPFNIGTGNLTDFGNTPGMGFGSGSNANSFGQNPLTPIPIRPAQPINTNTQPRDIEWSPYDAGVTYEGSDWGDKFFEPGKDRRTYRDEQSNRLAGLKGKEKRQMRKDIRDESWDLDGDDERDSRFGNAAYNKYNRFMDSKGMQTAMGVTHDMTNAIGALGDMINQGNKIEQYYDWRNNNRDSATLSPTSYTTNYAFDERTGDFALDDLVTSRMDARTGGELYDVDDEMLRKLIAAGAGIEIL